VILTSCQKKEKRKKKKTRILILRLAAELLAMHRLLTITWLPLPIRTCHSYNVGLNGGAPRYRVSTSASYGVDGLGDAGVRILSLDSIQIDPSILYWTLLGSLNNTEQCEMTVVLHPFRANLPKWDLDRLLLAAFFCTLPSSSCHPK
jgi:hypothetical protein